MIMMITCDDCLIFMGLCCHGDMGSITTINSRHRCCKIGRGVSTATHRMMQNTCATLNNTLMGMKKGIFFYGVGSFM